MPKLTVLAVFAAALLVCSSPATAQVRAPILAGTWYPADPIELSSTVKGMMDHAKAAEVKGRIVALVSPHAGYAYSGPTAAAAYTLLKGRHYDTVVILGPSHQYPFEGFSVYDHGPFRTPLGDVPLDADFIEKLKQANASVRYEPGAHAREHSLEIQLPFLQSTLKDFKLVPLVIGAAGVVQCRALAEALVRCSAGRSVLLIASTDLSHYHEAAVAEKMDATLAKCVELFDPACLAAKLGSGECEACGAAPLLTVMYAAAKLGANEAKILELTHSGRITGDNNRVVGYLSAALSDDGSGRKLDFAPTASRQSLQDAERDMLRDIAKEAIHAGLTDAAYIPSDDLPPALQTPSGAFVTIKLEGDLRGCIGHVLPRGSLAQTVAQCARAAAFDDPRFPPLTVEEFQNIDIEISVLSLLHRAKPEEVIVGRDGIFIRRGRYSGLLLPQVATEWSWDREMFLSQTCVKAGLRPDCWKDPQTEIYLFTAEVF
ncbi:MAG: hypothetical protein PWQ57_1827 [Desulfovibrionales bacterium]|nr:hypothetical protein [Desulfovibrionales bacterium]